LKASLGGRRLRPPNPAQEAPGEREDAGAVVDLDADPALEKRKHVGIDGQFSKAGEQTVVIDVVKKALDVRVHDPSEALAAELVDAVNGILDRAAFPEGIAALLEFRFEDFLGNEVGRRLQDAVPDGGDREAPDLGFALGNLELKERQRVVAAPDEAVLEPVQLDFEVFRELPDGDAIRAPAAGVLPDAVEGGVEGSA
jgi:hypothetical protein